MKKRRLTVALLGAYYGWGGGVDFVRQAANGLLTKNEQYDLSLFLLVPEVNSIETLLDPLRLIKRSIVDSIRTRTFSPALRKPVFDDLFLDFSRNVQGKVSIVYHQNTEQGLLRCLKRIGADVALPVKGSLGPNPPIRWVAYMPDFQHKYYPENFDVRECLDRDIESATILRDAKVVLVQSKAHHRDVLKFFPYSKAEIVDLPFSPIAVPEWQEECPIDVAATYGLPPKYFLISNQFWIHKDHLTAFRALLRIPAGRGISIVCTGRMVDYRKPGYVRDLKAFLSDNNLDKRVHLLGYIPKRHQIEIMKNSLAVLQPTLFEGTPGGLSVSDAVSMGVPVVLSDIEVNREIDADNVFFFRAGDSDDLAEKMTTFLDRNPDRPSTEMLAKSGHIGAKRLGDVLRTSIERVLL
jgi:glycosyltransferase involved in cell wall biosynthesis